MVRDFYGNLGESIYQNWSDELEIHVNQEGLELLIKTLGDLKKNGHDHLYTPGWAGSELTSEKVGDKNILLNKVTLKYWE